MGLKVDVTTPDGAALDGASLQSYASAVLVDVPASTRYLRAKWQVNRWGKGDTKPLFGIYLFAQLAQAMQPMFAAAG